MLQIRRLWAKSFFHATLPSTIDGCYQEMMHASKNRWTLARSRRTSAILLLHLSWKWDATRYCFLNYNIDHYHTVYFITSIIITGGHGTNFCGGKFFRKRHFAHLILPDRMYTDGVHLGACIKVCKTEGIVLIFCAFSYNMQWSSYMVARWYQVQFAWEMLYLICCTMYCILCCILYCIMYWWLARLWQMTPGRRKWSCRQPLPDATWTQTDDTAEINIIRQQTLDTIDMSKLLGLWHPRKSEYIYIFLQLWTLFSRNHDLAKR